MTACSIPGIIGGGLGGFFSGLRGIFVRRRLGAQRLHIRSDGLDPVLSGLGLGLALSGGALRIGGLLSLLRGDGLRVAGSSLRRLGSGGGCGGFGSLSSGVRLGGFRIVLRGLGRLSRSNDFSRLLFRCCGRGLGIQSGCGRRVFGRRGKSHCLG